MFLEMKTCHDLRILLMAVDVSLEKNFFSLCAKRVGKILKSSGLRCLIRVGVCDGRKTCAGSGEDATNPLPVLCYPHASVIDELIPLYVFICMRERCRKRE